MNASVYRTIALASLSCISACGTLYELDVTAHKEHEATGGSYVILSGDPDIPVGSGRFERYARQLETALDEHGYVRLGEDGLDDAEVAIYIAADIGDPKKEYHTVTRGVYESPDIQGAQAAARDTGNPDGSGQSGGDSSPSVLDRPPEEELAGYKKNAFATTVYTKHLSIIAVDLQQYLADIQEHGRSNAVARELWSVDVQTTGSPDDLDEAMPVMIAASQPYMGDNTVETVRVRLSEGDERVREIASARR